METYIVEVSNESSAAQQNGPEGPARHREDALHDYLSRVMELVEMDVRVAVDTVRMPGQPHPGTLKIAMEFGTSWKIDVAQSFSVDFEDSPEEEIMGDDEITDLSEITPGNAKSLWAVLN